MPCKRKPVHIAIFSAPSRLLQKIILTLNDFMKLSLVKTSARFQRFNAMYHESINC